MSAAQKQAERDHGDCQAEVQCSSFWGLVPPVLPGLEGGRQEASTPLWGEQTLWNRTIGRVGSADRPIGEMT